MLVLSVGAFATVVLVALTLVLLVHHGARLARFEQPAQPERIARVVAIGLGAWLLCIGLVAASGFFAHFENPKAPPRLLLVVVGAVSLFALVSRTATAARIIHALPLFVPIALQSFRVVVEIGLWQLYAHDQLPKYLTLEGRNFDVLVGITAPFVAFGLQRARIGKRVAVIWNVLSLLLLANIVGMAITSIPGPLHYSGWPGAPNTIVADFPFVWLPGFLVPVALFGHIVSLRQLLAMDAKNSADDNAKPLERRSSPSPSPSPNS